MKKLLTILMLLVVSVTFSQTQPLDFDSAPTMSDGDVFIIQRASDGLVYKLSWGTAEDQLFAGSGTSSFQIGDNANASGDYSFAIGNNTTSSGNYSMATGFNSNSSGIYSFTAGFSTLASGNNSFSIGRSSVASGINSFSGGFVTSSNAESTFSFGVETHANSFSEAAFGYFNDSLTANSTTNINVADLVFSVGNGTSVSNRNNAFEIFKNGAVLVDAMFYPGDTANITTGLITGMLANDEDGNLMQYNGTSWAIILKECGQFIQSAYVPQDSLLRTQITVVDTWEFLGGGENNKFIQTANQGFGFSGDTLVFTNGGCDADSVRFFLEYNATAQHTINSTIVSYAISINDTIVGQSFQKAFCRNAGEPYNLSQNAVLWLKVGDKIKILTQADNTGTIQTDVFSITLTRE